jgi:HD-GYP domain-containing protein (c-di-GMP phosphodiesterase class II)
LCLQVFRVKTCCIILKSHRKKPLSIKTVSKEEKNKNSLFYDKLFLRMLNRGQVLSNGKILMNKNKLCVPLTDEDIIGAICLMNKTDGAPFDEFDREILMTLSEQAAVAIKNAQLYQEQENMTIGSIKSLAIVLDTRAPGTYRVKESFIKIALAIGKELNLSGEDLRSLHYAAILHDAGQIAFPDKLLKKSDKLTGKEYSIIKRHPHKSVSIIKHLSFLKPLVPIILHHHENYDGSGYPKGLKGEKIPLGARIMAVASAFNAMITKRPYRRKVDVQSAIIEIKKNSGTQFDPRVVKIFLKVIQTNEIATLLEKGL